MKIKNLCAPCNKVQNKVIRNPRQRRYKRLAIGKSGSTLKARRKLSRIFI